MEGSTIAEAVLILLAAACLGFGVFSLHRFAYGFISRAESEAVTRVRRQEEAVKEREAHARSVENRRLMLAEHIITEGQGRTMTALEKLADPRMVATSRHQTNEAHLNKAVRSIADSISDPWGNRSSVRPVPPGTVDVPTFASPAPYNGEA